VRHCFTTQKEVGIGKVNIFNSIFRNIFVQISVVEPESQEFYTKPKPRKNELVLQHW
jgi:hypothetical protein